MTNPLLEQHTLPPFSAIRPEHIEPAIRHLIERNKRRINELVAVPGAHNWESLMQPIEDMEDELAQCWSPVSHLNGVLNSEPLRQAHNTCLPLLSEYSTWMGQHTALYEAYRELSESSASSNTLTPPQRKALDNALRDFRLAGVALPADQKQRYGELQQRLSELGSRFTDNVLDATNAWSKEVNAEDLAGLPATALASACQAAQQKGLEGCLLTLEFPSVQPVLTYCDNAALREEVYTANVTRASELGPHAGRWDNSGLITEILDLRQELASLLGFGNYAELSLVTKMAPSTSQVVDFLVQLAERSRPQAEQEWRDLQEFAATSHGKTSLEPWDVAYYSEKLRQSTFNVSQEEVRPYLPVNRVLPGLFQVVERLYGIQVEEIDDFDTYHPDARLFELRQDGEALARFYLDLYARSGKRGGAWMGDCRARRIRDSQLQLPVAYLVCNFTPPVGEEPSLLTENEMTTLFHEFGHGLHHMLTQQQVAAVSGINGVAWDAVELPSQFLENWCHQPEALAFISGHYETGESLPAALLEKMLAAKNFQAGMQMVRQLEFSLFDFRLHQHWGEPGVSVQGLLDTVRHQVAVIPAVPFNRFQNSFSHIFGGGYAAGYYSYKWAEVLSADAFSRFEEEGIFNPHTGQEFRRHILEAGGSRDAMSLFVAFRGREPELEPLLRHCGIAA
ncbi:oligopeptidase A [Kineobactrum sediminis]|uniref:oligopeptidase A n=1 Tax=Kineobactrum sediminis TaxID=1905677 RepID=A0A2N5Y0J6_9GAMM|nr:oligopeptidase A [Kineobactrum sediminis]PLW81920.1 oligopeptidase A [Kineobactrum sediminis]